MIDYGRSAVYSLEDQVTSTMERGGLLDFHGTTLVIEPDMRFGVVDDMQRYVDLAWPRVGFGKSPVIRPSKGHRRAYYAHSTHTIHVPDARWSRTRFTLLHEIAHAVVRVEGLIDPGHGQEWRKTFCSVLDTCGMPEVALLMRAGFDSL